MPTLRKIPQFIQCVGYSVDIPWDYLEEWLKRHEEYPGMDLDPDFQRGHVWTEDRQIAYVEFVAKGGGSASNLWWNCPGWRHGPETPMVLVDGKQRLQAALRFLRDEIPLFGSVFSQYDDKIIPHVFNFKMNVNHLKTHKEVLTWYLQMNSGGVVHTPEELNKVEELLRKEK